MSENIVVDEGEAPLLTFQIKEKLLNGTTRAWSLLGVDEIVFLTKSDLDLTTVVFDYRMTDGEIHITEDGIDPTDEYSEVTVQMKAADTVTPQNLFYWLRLFRGTRNDDVKKGFLEITNV